jgi:hypothetical protein
MKKFAISLIALAAISTASFAAGNRSYDLDDLNMYSSAPTPMMKNEAVKSNALVIVKKTSAATAFDRLNWTAWENITGGGH